MIVGEKMSSFIEFDQLIWTARGDAYEDQEQLIRDRPLDIGRLMYAKLRQALDDECAVEVYWDHIRNLLTLVIDDDSSGRRFDARFMPAPFARTDLLQRVDQYIESVKDTVYEQR